MTNCNQDSEASWFIIQNNDSILLNKNNTLPSNLDIAPIAPHFLRQFKLDSVNNKDYFCGEIAQNTNLTDTLHALPLRKVLALLHDETYGMAVKAYSVINWDKNHRFCGRCGAYTIHQSTTFERVCQSCELTFYPRISPSIIVLIHREDHLVMARSPHFLPGIYGLIAGFVEAGESLEETVHREVKEEVGLNIQNLSYFGSQPWPFPDSLMVAYMAEYASGEIQVDEEEIEDAGWYKYDNLPGRSSSTVSISSMLIDHFVKSINQQVKVGQ